MNSFGATLSAAVRSPATYRLVKFLAVGVLNTLVGYGIFAGVMLISGSPIGSLAVATVLGVLFNFKSIGKLVFRNSDNRLLPRFLGVYAGQFAINALSLHALTIAGISPFVAQLIILPPLAVLTFVAMQRVVFTNSRSEAEQ